ncbi:uncharacterized protein LOC133130042 [Conger conger]|uniref:uncharacterized protein LOC133130042 n=1 Tax=Conger conger TaxID=82655 RepID=UPI002A59F9C2|nr:uncharacterized protein LOC133130042 [Conger conger]
MDPAETEQLRHALSTQGARVGQHERALVEIMDSLKDLSAGVNQLSGRMDKVVTMLPTVPPPDGAPASTAAVTDHPPASPVPLGFPSNHHREPYIPTPAQYAVLDSSLSDSPGEPMQLGRMRLTPSERQRRVRQGLCVYCGQAGHFLAACPTLPKDQAHTTSSTGPPTRLTQRGLTLARLGGRCFWADSTSRSPIGQGPATPNLTPFHASLLRWKRRRLQGLSFLLPVWSGAARLEVERVVQEAQQDQPPPEECLQGRLFIPEATRSPVLQWGHTSKVACHPGFHRTLALIQQRFWWPTMSADTREFVPAP